MTSVFFESMPKIVLQILILTQVIDCAELLRKKDFFDVLVVSLGSTVLSITMTLIESALVARAL